MLRQDSWKIVTLAGIAVVIVLTLYRYLGSFNHGEAGSEYKYVILSEDKMTQYAEPAYRKEIALEKARLKIRTELANYNFSRIPGVNTINDLIPENGGNPLRTLIVTTWRSGSTFTAEILTSVPGTFFHHEPLYNLYDPITNDQRIRVRGPPNSIVAVKNLTRMFKCDFSDMQDYFNYAKNHKMFQFRRNYRIWDHCNLMNEDCLDSEFVGKYCKLFPFQLMKTTRIRLQLAREFLEDSTLNLKVILLVRDPRGVLQSRRIEPWCRPSPDCIEPSIVCEDMVSDYITAFYLLNKYPDRFMVVRYEDLALNTGNIVPRLLDFTGIGFVPAVEEYLREHTTRESGGAFTTYRVTNETVFRWKYKMDYDYLLEIQSQCKDAMHYWGYVQAQSKSELHSDEFIPIIDYHL